MKNNFIPEEHGLPDLNDPFWNKRICLKPWSTLYLGAKGTTPCCLRPESRYRENYDAFQGPFHKGDVDFWNCDKFVKFRKDMCEIGPVETCHITIPVCHCKNPFPTLKEQIPHTVRQIGLKNTIQLFKDVYNNNFVLDHGPYDMGISVTCKCNANCSFCLQTMFTRENVEINEEAIKNASKIINNAYTINLIGGEVFAASKETIQSVFSNLSPDLRISIITNGKGLDLEMYEMIINECPKTGFHISMNNASLKDIEEGKVRENLFNFEKNMKEIYAKYPKHNIQHVSCVMITSVIPYLHELIDFMNMYNIPGCTIVKVDPTALYHYQKDDEDPLGRGFNEEVFRTYMRSSKLMREKAKKYNKQVIDQDEIDAMMIDKAKRSGITE